MAFEKREIEEIICDACGVKEEVFEGPPEGWYNGEAIFHTYDGGSGGDWAACKPAHIKKAVEAVTGTGD